MAANWKTTLAGALAVLIVVCQQLIPWLQTGTPISWATIAAAVAGGIGLIAARDHDGPMTPPTPGGH
jgi:hypothetical protein